MVPTALKGSDFEKLLMDAAKREEAAGLLTMGRYGVDGMVVAGKNGGASHTLLIPSKPDFEGVLASGRQFIIEAKVWQKKAFEINPAFIKVKQVSHMLKRSSFGVPCFLLIHFAERRGVNFVDPAITVAIPVTDQCPMWQKFVDAAAAAKTEGKKLGGFATISRDEAQDMGKLVPWCIPKGCRKALPDLLSFLWPEARAIQVETIQPALFD